MWGYALVMMRLASTSVFTGAAKLSEASFSVFNTASSQGKSLEHSALHNLKATPNCLLPSYKCSDPSLKGDNIL